MGNDWITGAIVMVVWLAVGAMFYNRSHRKAKQRRQQQERQAKFARLREEREDKRPTMVETMDMELSSLRYFTPRGEDLTAKGNAIIARLEMEDDLGHYAEGPRPIDLDQPKRDLLLAHARRDAAEALANSKSVLEEVRMLRRTFDEMVLYGGITAALIVLAIWVKSGRALW